MLNNVEIFCIRHTFDMTGAWWVVQSGLEKVNYLGVFNPADESTLMKADLKWCSLKELLSDVSVSAQENGAGAFVGVHSVFQRGCCICECISVCLLASETTVDTIEIYSFMSDHEAKLKCPCE